MKPPRFAYAAPRDLDAAIGLLADGGPDARPLAGGQSLLPALNLRLSRPSLLVDLGRIPGLRGLRREPDGTIVAGAMTRHHDFETDPLVDAHLPLVHAAMPKVAHLPIRTRGTIGGSLAHADPAADWSALCLASDARCVLRSADGERTVSARDLSTGFFSTAIADGELLVAVRFPPWPAQRRWGLQKFTRRHGDFAIVGAVATVDVERDGRVSSAVVVLYGIDGPPMQVPRVGDELVGDLPTPDRLQRAARRAAAEAPVRSDLHASAAFRTELVEVLTRRALAQAVA